MKSISKRIISSMLAIVTLFFWCVPTSFASVGGSVSVEIGVTDFMDWMVKAGTSDLNFFKSLVDDDICPHSTAADGHHNFVQKHTQVGGRVGNFYICEYCGKSAGEVGEEAYQQQVDGLPVSGITSAGRLIWYTWDSFDGAGEYGHLSNTYSGSKIFSYHEATGLPFWAYREQSTYNTWGVYYSVDSSGKALSCITRQPNYTQYYFGFGVKCNLSVPVSGSYKRLPTTFYASRLQLTDGTVEEDSAFYSSDGSFVHHDLGQAFSISFTKQFYSYCAYASAVVSFPVYEIIPDTAISGDTYNIITRPTTITGGNYGIVGDNGQITTVTNTTQIINEGDNIYYNPATGQTQTITDWTYNYDGRNYNITLDTGDKVSVEYGDENITITENTVNEGDTIVNNYTIYYMIDGSGSGDNPDPTPGPTVCPHDWQSTSTTAATCTAPGKTVYTCSKCGETKTETVPALGHDWKVVRTVPTAYGEDGNQTQAGYTLYECSRCGEQYKDQDGTGPPGDDVDDGGLLAWLNGLIKHLSDNLSGVVALIKRFFTEIPELFSGFTGFLAAVFPFLPEEITLLLTFGMASLVVVGVIKAIRR